MRIDRIALPYTERLASMQLLIEVYLRPGFIMEFIDNPGWRATASHTAHEVRRVMPSRLVTALVGQSAFIGLTPTASERDIWVTQHDFTRFCLNVPGIYIRATFRGKTPDRSRQLFVHELLYRGVNDILRSDNFVPDDVVLAVTWEEMVCRGTPEPYTP